MLSGVVLVDPEGLDINWFPVCLSKKWGKKEYFKKRRGPEWQDFVSNTEVENGNVRYRGININSHSTVKKIFRSSLINGKIRIIFFRVCQWYWNLFTYAKPQPFSLKNNSIYYIDTSVLLENIPLVKFIRNHIRDSSGVFFISH